MRCRLADPVTTVPNHAFNPSMFDVRVINLPDMPPEWEPVDDELLEYLKPDEHGMTALAQEHVIEDLVADRWFLVKNTFGFRCRNCRSGTLISPGSMPGTIHPYITYACQERPFNGLNEVLMFWRHALGERLDPSRFQDRRKTPMERDELKQDFDAVTQRIGDAIEPISPSQAHQLYFKIEMITRRDFAWEDFRARYIRRYKEYLRALGWDPHSLATEQWKTVHTAARREYASRERR